MKNPWRDETSTIDRFPRCAAYLKGMGVNVEKHPISNYYAAVILADKFEESEYEEHKIDFSLNSGTELLAAIERMFFSKKVSKAQKPQEKLSDGDYIRLMAFIGSRGVKTSELLKSDDIWKAAMILWPKIKRGTDLNDLFLQIKMFSKAQRKVANENIKNLPENWIAKK